MKAKNPAAVALGRLGGKASARSLTKEQRRKRAQKARQTQLARKEAMSKPNASSKTSDGAAAQ
jgi:hypothetical protein